MLILEPQKLIVKANFCLSNHQLHNLQPFMVTFRSLAYTIPHLSCIFFLFWLNCLMCFYISQAKWGITWKKFQQIFFSSQSFPVRSQNSILKVLQNPCRGNMPNLLKKIPRWSPNVNILPLITPWMINTLHTWYIDLSFCEKILLFFVEVQDHHDSPEVKIRIPCKHKISR